MTNPLGPLLGNNNTKNSIINALGDKPLTLKQLHQIIERNTTKGISYQATHKAVTEMINEGILTKSGRNIEISSLWLEKMHTIISSFKSKKDNTINKTETKNITYEFSTFVDAGKFIIKAVFEAPNPKRKEGVSVFHHAWPFVGMNEQDLERLKGIAKDPFYDIIINDTALDRVFGNVLSDVGKHVKLGINITYPFDVFVKGDTIFQVYFSKDFTEKYYSLFNKYKKLEMLSIRELMEKMITHKTEIKIIQIEDQQAADEIRKEVLKYFE